MEQVTVATCAGAGPEVSWGWGGCSEEGGLKRRWGGVGQGRKGSGKMVGRLVERGVRWNEVRKLGEV